MTALPSILRCLLAALLLTALVPERAAAQEFQRTILTGGPTGTYIEIGRDIAGLMESCGQTLTVEETAGSLENLLGVRQRTGTQFGIVQSDVLEYLQTYAAQDSQIRRAIDGMRIAFPLYNEEVHILATRALESTDDLDGARVAIGVDDSGTFLTASLMLDLLGVAPAERLTIGPDEAMERLRAGDIDAFFFVSGAPTPIFEDDTIDPERFHLLPITDDVLRSVYTPARIEAGTYPFQQEAVDVVAVKAILMTYEYVPSRNAYHRESCRTVSDVSHLILTRIDTLRETGHPKWRKVDLQDVPPGWDVSRCVLDGIDPGYRSSCTPPAPEPALPEDSGTNALYRQRICAIIEC